MSAPFMDDEQLRDEPVFRWFRSSVHGVPREYNVKTFGRRMIDHVIVYSAILLFSVFLVFFWARPIETGIIALCLSSVVAVIFGASSGRRVKWPQRLARIVEFVLAGGLMLLAGSITKLAQQLLLNNF